MTGPRSLRLRHTVLAAGLGAALTLTASACTEVTATSSAGYHPAKIEAIAGLETKRVTLTQEGASRIGLREDSAAQQGQHTAVSYAALIYDSKGVPWVYTAVGPLAYQRTKVVVARVDGDRVLLTGGLRPGSAVVTVGATELYGAELGIEGGH